MKKWSCFLLILAMLLSLSACGNDSADQGVDKNEGVKETAGAVRLPPQTEPPEEPSVSAGDIDVDLTQLSSTMIYSEVYNMMMNPEDYTGKRVKMKGQFAVYEDQATDNIYFAAIIADATACCSQGIEFVWEGDHAYPEDYPELGSEITVDGEFQTYEENGNLYCHLIEADLT